MHPKDFFSTRAKGCKVYRNCMYNHYTEFKGFYETKQEVWGDGAEDLSVFESLYNYMDKNPCKESK